jgi:LDH2 family malate/lactate/ureidoglycolate dehydrogenase
VKRYPIERLREFVVSVFRGFEIPPDDAELAADVLEAADLRGIDSHGVARMYSYYGMLEAGRINAHPRLRVVRETPSTASVDGDNGLGLVVGPKANRIAMDKAAQVGSGWVAVRNTNHYGIAGYYVLEALKLDIIGWSMTNSTPLVAPLWGAARMLGTNPLAIAFPGREEPPVVIDLATSTAAFGKIEMARREKRDVPEGWLVDEAGRPTRDPNRMFEGGAQLPLGSTREQGGHKGYCLAAMVDMLTAVLSGANWGPFAPPFALGQEIPKGSVGEGIGHFFGAMRIDAFMDVDVFKGRVDEWIRSFRATTPAEGTRGPLIPGDPERDAEADRRANGVPLIGAVVEELREISRRSGVPFE